MNNPGIIIQARLTSTRFPNKNLCPFMGKPLIDWIIEACKKSGIQFVVAIPENKTDAGLKEYLETKFGKVDFGVFTGNKEDLILRFKQVNDILHYDPIIRICSDNPFVAPEDILLALNLFNDRKYYTRINHVEVFSALELDWADDNTLDMGRREHCANMCYHTVDTVEDLHVLERAWNEGSPTMDGIKKLWGRTEKSKDTKVKGGMFIKRNAEINVEGSQYGEL